MTEQMTFALCYERPVGLPLCQRRNVGRTTGSCWLQDGHTGGCENGMGVPLTTREAPGG